VIAYQDGGGSHVLKNNGYISKLVFLQKNLKGELQ
jgi:hypothetical protein